MHPATVDGGAASYSKFEGIAEVRCRVVAALLHDFVHGEFGGLEQFHGTSHSQLRDVHNGGASGERADLAGKLAGTHTETSREFLYGQLACRHKSDAERIHTLHEFGIGLREHRIPPLMIFGMKGCVTII